MSSSQDTTSSQDSQPAVAPEILLERVTWLANYPRETLKVVTYHQAERDSEQLASNLQAKFGYKEVKSFAFRPIPRGGHIVLGMLSYCLDLPYSAFDSSNRRRPVIVVDDCAHSGTRLRGFLDKSDFNEVVFGVLYSNSQLFDAILSRESRVVDCLMACELEDFSSKRFVDISSLEQWRQSWIQRKEHAAYWIGDLQHVIFPWNEPDRAFWNSQKKMIENGWRFASPDECLRNRTLLGIPLSLRSDREFRLTRGLAYNLFDDEVLICNLSTEEVFSLSGIASRMWRALVWFGNLNDSANYLARDHDVDLDQLRLDLREFVNDLVSRGILELL